MTKTIKKTPVMSWDVFCLSICETFVYIFGNSQKLFFQFQIVQDESFWGLYMLRKLHYSLFLFHCLDHTISSRNWRRDFQISLSLVWLSTYAPLTLFIEPVICIPNITAPRTREIYSGGYIFRCDVLNQSFVQHDSLHPKSLHQKQERLCVWVLWPQGWEGYIFCCSQG